MPLTLKTVSPTDPAAISPKVSRPAWAVLALAALTGALEVITPEMLDFLGDWKGAAYLVVGVLLQVAVGYKATDPRVPTADPEPAPAPAPAPETAPAPALAAPVPDPDLAGDPASLVG